MSNFVIRDISVSYIRLTICLNTAWSVTDRAFKAAQPSEPHFLYALAKPRHYLNTHSPPHSCALS